MRIYRQVGFDLHPQMFLTGTVDRSAIPVVEKVREGGAGDVELMDSLDRAARGAAHGAGPRADAADLAAAGLRHQHRVRLRLPQRARPVALLAATNRRTAVRLLWAALAEAPSRPPCRTSRGPTSGRSTWGSRPG